jgi:hypothetical protein
LASGPREKCTRGKSGNDFHIQRWYEKRKIGDGPDVNASVYNPTGPDATKWVPHIYISVDFLRGGKMYISYFISLQNVKEGCISCLYVYFLSRKYIQNS